MPDIVYTPTTWRDKPSIDTPLDAVNLNKLENGVAAAVGQANTAVAQVGSLLPLAARNPDLLIAGTVTRDANGAATSAPVVWPDGNPGTYTADTVSTAFPGAVDGYHITYGSPVTKTFTQPTITRNASGAATAVPAIVVT